MKAQGTIAEPEDSVKFHEAGWKHRYYKNKLNIDIDNDQDAVRKYYF